MEKRVVRAAIQPQKITITDNAIYIASNITPYEIEVDDHVLTGYEYDCEVYNKDEYFALQNEKIVLQNEQITLQNEKIAALEQELQAAKILLGVD